MIWRPQYKNKERGSLVKNDQQINVRDRPQPSPRRANCKRERERDKYIAKLTQGHQSHRREDKVRTQVEEGEGQDAAGAERPSGVLRQSSDLNLGPRAEEGGRPHDSGRYSWTSSLPMALVTTGQHPSLPQSVSKEVPPPPPAQCTRPGWTQRHRDLGPGLRKWAQY